VRFPITVDGSCWNSGTATAGHALCTSDTPTVLWRYLSLSTSSNDGMYCEPTGEGLSLGLTSVTPSPTRSNSAPWHKDGNPSKDCAWVALDAASRCSKVNADDVTAASACARSCRGSGDSTSWHKSGNPEKGCAWVAADAEKRCSKVDAGDVTAVSACKKTCLSHKK